MLKQLLLIGACLFGTGLSLTASAAVSVTPISIQCPDTVVGSESVCTINGAPWTEPLTMTFFGSGTRTSDDTGPFSVSSKINSQFRTTLASSPTSACVTNKAYTASSQCSYPKVLTFKPTVAGQHSGNVYFLWAPNGCTNSCPEVWITITGTALANPTYTYQWQSSQFSTCGGTGAWSYGDWLPAIGSACTTALEQTREATCVPNVDSGTQVRNVNCVRDQDSVVVADSFCAAPKPPTSQICTPTNPNCGTKDTVTRNVSDLSSCTYEWSASQTWSGCSGGSGEWMFGEWAPATGCGITHQLRTVACSVTTDSGLMTRAVDCVRSDGTSVGDTHCQSQPRPASEQPCTPTSSACGTTPATQQDVTLSSACPDGGTGDDEDDVPTQPTQPTKKELCVPDAANHKYCVWMNL